MLKAVAEALGEELRARLVFVGGCTTALYITDPIVLEGVRATDDVAVPRWEYGEEFLALLDSLEAALPLARGSDLSDEPMARMIFQLSEGLIGETVAIVTTAAIAAVRSGAERIAKAGIDELRYVPVSKRRRAPLRDDLL